MKYLRTVIFIFCMSLMVMSQVSMSQVFEGVVTQVTAGKVATIVFDSPNRDVICSDKPTDTNCVTTIMDVPRKSWPEEWGKFPTKGTLLKARWEGRSLIPIKSCEVRQREAMLKYCGDPPDYCRPPQSATPFDCNAPKSKLIQSLLDKAAQGMGTERLP